jgi:hypothetical protein
MANLYSVPLKNSVQHTLAGTLTIAETGTITLDSSVVLELQATATMKGLLVVDRVDVNGTLTPTKTEFISYTGVTGSTVTGLTRAVAGTTAQGHAIGAIVEFVPDITWAQAINDVLTTQHNSDGTHKTLSLISLVSVTINNSLGFGVSLASSTIFNSSLDSFTFKSALSGATQGDLIVFNAGAFTRLGTASLNNILSITSTASGLLPGYVTPQSTASYFVSNTSATTVTPNAFTEITNSSVTLTLNQTSHIKYNYSFLMQNNTANRFWNTSIYKDASAVKNNNHQGVTAGIGVTFSSSYLEKNVTAGTYSYKLYIKNSTTSDSLTYSSAGSDIIVEVIPA